MLASERQAEIAAIVRRHRAVRVADLAERFGVSDMTVRRDLDVLAERELLIKVHGGAVAVSSSAAEPGFDAKSMMQRAEKEAIAERAAALVEPGLAVAVSAGTTTWMLAHRLVEVPELTVVTNSPPVAEVFHRKGRADQTVVLTGGIRTPSDALVGPIAIAAIESLNLDVLLLGVHGMSVRAGFTTPNLLESETDRALMRRARRRVVLADHSKWETTGISTIAPLNDADVLVSDAGLSAEARDALSEHVGEVLIA